jgi:hypothetical protein
MATGFGTISILRSLLGCHTRVMFILLIPIIFFFASSKAETSSFLDEKLGQKSHEQRYGFYIGCIDCVWLLGGIGVGHRDQVVRDGN